MLILLCVLVVTMRIGGAHLHLCLDGSEPPATLHLENDGGVHHAHESTADAGGIVHQDLDVALANDALVKKPGLDADLPELVVVTILLLYLLRQVLGSLFPADLRVLVTAHRAHLRPLLRGPPALASH